MSRYHTHLRAPRWAAVRRAVFKRDGWRQQVQRKRLTWRAVFGGRGSAE